MSKLGNFIQRIRYGRKRPGTGGLHTSADGKPLVTKIAQLYPNRTRRERRAILRTAIKASQKGACMPQPEVKRGWVMRTLKSVTTFIQRTMRRTGGAQ